jgi:hypothetical protein
MAVTKVRTKQQLLVTDNVSFESAYRITNLVDPSGAQDAATKAYVDATKTGLDFKDSVKAATTGAETYSITAGAVTQITGTTNIDGVAILVGDRILIKNAPAATGAGAGAGSANTTQPANGIYVVTNNTTNLTVSRATDADSSAEVTSGMYVFVSEGTDNLDSGFVLITNDSITLNTTPLQFTQFSGAGQIIAGAGLTKTGNTINVVTANVNRIVVNADNIDLALKTPGTTPGSALRKLDFDAYGRLDQQANAAAADLDATFGSQVANYVYAAPNGSTGNPTFRALVAADFPALPYLSNTTTSTQSGYFGDIYLRDDSTPSHYLQVTNSANLTAARVLSINVNDGDRTIDLSGNLTVSSAATVSGTNTGDQTITLTGDVSGTGTGSFSTALATITQSTGSNFVKITLDTKGRVTGNTAVSATDLHNTYGSQGPNLIYASPNGGTGNPSFRSLVAADIPSLSYLSSSTTSTQNGYFGDIYLYDDVTTPSHYLQITNFDNLTAARVLRIVVNDADRTISLGGSITTAAAFTTSGAFSLTLTTTGATNVTLPTSGTLLTSTNYVVREAPSGTPNGSLTTFGLANTPIAGKEMVFVNGVLQNAGSGNDYQLSGSNVVFEAAATPQTGDIILVTYLK